MLQPLERLGLENLFLEAVEFLEIVATSTLVAHGHQCRCRLRLSEKSPVPANIGASKYPVFENQGIGQHITLGPNLRKEPKHQSKTLLGQSHSLENILRTGEYPACSETGARHHGAAATRESLMDRLIGPTLETD